ncbi:MFS transporter [Telmatospirillum sp.]|uniref:MFS transporter n=1 Tax=Telmatospirillum sp. TaxID=2079197 RepID=UPI002847E34D|nr:MFS transporter [Telmatospirillum sp.]MDR3435744.1 MFS transporter [Telmatospirillum sp.]
MTPSTNRLATRVATRLAFLAAGFGMGCWSPLIPYAKIRLGVGDAEIGLLLLCLGIGSILAMPITGLLSSRMGSRAIIVASGVGLAAMLPILALAESLSLMAPALLVFGASLGSLDVAMNVHAVKVESDSDKPLMSGFHALFSIGGFAGSGGLTFLLSMGVSPFPAAVSGGVVTLAAVLLAWPGLLRTRQTRGGGSFALPRGIVLLLSVLVAAAFLTEGAILDWGALVVTESGLVSVSQGGLGYMLFSIAMTAGRLSGDWIVARAGNFRVLVWGGAVTVLGFVILLVAPIAAAAMVGFLLIGLGSSNIVPVLFSQAGRQTAMPAGLAIAALTTTGYAGILAGPAVIGFVAHAIGLKEAFWMLAGLMSLISIFAKRAAR